VLICYAAHIFDGAPYARRPGHIRRVRRRRHACPPPPARPLHAMSAQHSSICLHVICHSIVAMLIWRGAPQRRQRCRCHASRFAAGAPRDAAAAARFIYPRLWTRRHEYARFCYCHGERYEDAADRRRSDSDFLKILLRSVIAQIPPRPRRHDAAAIIITDGSRPRRCRLPDRLER